jgi:hypothetical protein
MKHVILFGFCLSWWKLAPSDVCIDGYIYIIYKDWIHSNLYIVYLIYKKEKNIKKKQNNYQLAMQNTVFCHDSNKSK